jgi:ADP-heptose:LPS heptosyltransferase
LIICALLFGAAQLRSLFGGRRLPPMRATTPPVPGSPPLAPRRVLAIKFYGLGNIAMVLPAMQALRDRFPTVEIDFMTMRENVALLERSNLIHRTLPVEVDSYRTFLASLWEAFRTLRRRRYDVVVDFEQFVKLSTILSFLSGAPDRIGFNTDGQRRGWLYTIRVVYTDSEHMSRIFMRLLRPFGIRGDETRPLTIKTQPAEEERVELLLRDGGIEPGRFPLVAVHVGSGANFYRIPLKRWPIANFARLCDALAERHGAAIVFTGKGDEERALVDETKALMRTTPIDACDRLSITELLALLRQCHITVTNDTSVMHLAAALRTAVVAFFGPTAPLHYGPGNPEDLVFYQELYCSPCLTNYNLKVSRCMDPICIRTISVEEVLADIEARFLNPEAPLRATLEAQAGVATSKNRVAAAPSHRRTGSC